MLLAQRLAVGGRIRGRCFSWSFCALVDDVSARRGARACREVALKPLPLKVPIARQMPNHDLQRDRRRFGRCSQPHAWLEQCMGWVAMGRLWVWLVRTLAFQSAPTPGWGGVTILSQFDCANFGM